MNSLWPNAAVQLDGYRRFNEEAALRDHRKLGLELDLFRWTWWSPARMP